MWPRLWTTGSVEALLRQGEDVPVALMTIRLPHGSLKIKRRHELRNSEYERRVPVWKIGGLYFIWRRSS